MIKPWFVLPCASANELSLEKKIRSLGYGAMAPWDSGQRRMRNGCYRDWKFPLYTGYVFVSLPHAALEWQRLCNVLNHGKCECGAHVFRAGRRLVFPLLMEGGAPAILRPADAEYLQSISDGRYENYAKSLVVGDTILVPEGHFQGQSALLSKIKHSKKRGNRATVKIKGEKNDVTIDFPLESLRRA